MTEMLPISDNSINRAASILHAGGLVAFPTETVYGLGADACNQFAVARIFSAKKRPYFNPLISHVADSKSAFDLGTKTEFAAVLADTFWPGPITLILQRTIACPIAELVTAGHDKIAIRVPAHTAANKLLTIFGRPIAAPSANLSGRISPSTATHVKSGLDKRLDLILDGGPCKSGLESTIVDCSGVAPVLLRPGGISREAVDFALLDAGIVVKLINTEKIVSDSQLISPGQLRSHYAPSAELRLNATKALDGEELIGFGSVAGAGVLSLSLSPTGNLLEAAANLFAMLHHADIITSKTNGVIAIAPVPEIGIGAAINDRLQRAAAPRK